MLLLISGLRTIFLSLQDAWNDGLSSKYLDDPDDVEAKRVFDALREYTVEFEARVDKARESVAAGWKCRHESEIDEKILDRLIDTAPLHGGLFLKPGGILIPVAGKIGRAHV